jgi:hypothetical protein
MIISGIRNTTSHWIADATRLSFLYRLRTDHLVILSAQQMTLIVEVIVDLRKDRHDNCSVPIDRSRCIDLSPRRSG